MIFSGFFENIKMSISDRSSSWILEYFCRSFLRFFFSFIGNCADSFSSHLDIVFLFSNSNGFC